MNLLLFEADEVAADGAARLAAADPRARHLREVLAVAVGRELEVGVVDGGVGQGTVTSVAEAGITVACRLAPPPPPPPADRLLLAVPRPKVLLRVLELAAALGYARIVLVRTWFVDRSHLLAAALDPDRIAAHLRRGLAQARRTRLPRVQLEPLFRPFVEDRLPELVAGSVGVAACPRAARNLGSVVVPAAAPFTLAVGPERGFTAFELDALAASGCPPAAAGPHPLKVESAVAYLSGRLHARRDR